MSYKIYTWSHLIRVLLLSALLATNSAALLGCGEGEGDSGEPSEDESDDGSEVDDGDSAGEVQTSAVSMPESLATAAPGSQLRIAASPRDLSGRMPELPSTQAVRRVAKTQTAAGPRTKPPLVAGLAA